MVPGVLCALAFICTALLVSAPVLSGRIMSVRGSKRWSVVELITAGGCVLLVALGIRDGIRLGIMCEALWDRTGAHDLYLTSVEFTLMAIHARLILLCVVSIAALLWHRFRGFRPGLLAAVSASVIVPAAAAAAFFMTLPSGGDEGVAVWLLLAPAMTLFASLLFVVALVVFIQALRHEGLFRTLPR